MRVALLLGLLVMLMIIRVQFLSGSSPVLSRGTLAWYVERLKPGMTEHDVKTSIPTQFFGFSRSILPCSVCTNTQHRVDLSRCLQANTPVSTKQSYTDIQSNMGIAHADVFFSPTRRIVGWRFSASGAETPRGAYEIQVTVPVVELNKELDAGQQTGAQDGVPAAHDP